MISTLLASLGTVTGSSVSMLVLLLKATWILLVELGIPLTMQRASAGARHLVWLVTLGALLLVPALTAWGPIPFRVLPATAASTRNSGSAVPATAPTQGVDNVNKIADLATSRSKPTTPAA